MRIGPFIPLFAWLGLFAFACGGKAVVDGVANQGGGGSAADPFAGVACGSAGSCTFECCLDLTQMNPEPFCATNCSTGITALSCDGPEDCAGGVCCGNVSGASCSPSCEFDDLQFCHEDEDCPDFGSCTPADVASVSFDTCMR